MLFSSTLFDFFLIDCHSHNFLLIFTLYHRVSLKAFLLHISWPLVLCAAYQVQHNVAPLWDVEKRQRRCHHVGCCDWKKNSVKVWVERRHADKDERVKCQILEKYLPWVVEWSHLVLLFGWVRMAFCHFVTLSLWEGISCPC